MDPERFNTITQSLIATGSRRDALAAAVAGIGAMVRFGDTGTDAKGGGGKGGGGKRGGKGGEGGGTGGQGWQEAIVTTAPTAAIRL